MTLCAIVTDENLNEIDRYTGNIRPKYLQWWSEEAEKVHGISKDVAAGFDDSHFIINEFTHFLHSTSDSFSFVCHALPVTSNIDLFDRNFVFSWYWLHDMRVDYYSLFPEDQIRSTILKKKTEARKRWNMSSQSLGAWMEKLDIDPDNHHNAEFDAEVCLEILRYQMKGEI